ncbi:hypothetical protein SPHINGOAX6_30304 [Sphingomonas sp. AX6]|nr:hypothetical protein SPHINGOAX6_30304 [Sphingomonas sp. AX6]
MAPTHGKLFKLIRRFATLGFS